MSQAPHPFTQAASQGYGDYAATLDDEEQEDHHEEQQHDEDELEGPQSPEPEQEEQEEEETDEHGRYIYSTRKDILKENFHV